jgi:hypothetical protein
MRGFRWMRWVGILMLLLGAKGAEADAAPRVVWLRVEGALTPVVADYLRRGIETAQDQGAEALVLQLSTPGGEVNLTLRLVSMIRESAVPVIVYVAPRGAIAGSAGTLVTLAGHLAWMAPETAIGAASPVGGQGEDLPRDPQPEGQRDPESPGPQPGGAARPGRRPAGGGRGGSGQGGERSGGPGGRPHRWDRREPRGPAAPAGRPNGAGVGPERAPCAPRARSSSPRR